MQDAQNILRDRKRNIHGTLDQLQKSLDIVTDRVRDTRNKFVTAHNKNSSVSNENLVNLSVDSSKLSKYLPYGMKQGKEYYRKYIHLD